jgi:hypothetical protein
MQFWAIRAQLIAFRVGAEDAPHLVREFHDRFELSDLTQPPHYQIYVKLMIDGSPVATVQRRYDLGRQNRHVSCVLSHMRIRNGFRSTAPGYMA